MALKFGATEVGKMAKVIDAEYATVEEAAEAVLKAAVEIVESRARYTVIGGLKWTPERKGWLNDEEARKARVCLGFFSTEGDAKAAGESLAFSAASGEEWAWRMVEVEHSTPTAWHGKRRTLREAAVLRWTKEQAEGRVERWQQECVDRMRAFMDSLSEKDRKALEARVDKAVAIAAARREVAA